MMSRITRRDRVKSFSRDRERSSRLVVAFERVNESTNLVEPFGMVLAYIRRIDEVSVCRLRADAVDEFIECKVGGHGKCGARSVVLTLDYRNRDRYATSG